MRLVYILAAMVIGCGAASAQTQDIYKPKMTKAEATSYLKRNNMAILPDYLPQVIMGGNVDALEALVVAGLDLKAKGSFPQTPLDLAALSCSPGTRIKQEDTLRMIDLLLGGGVDPNQEGMAGLSALMIAAQQQCPPIVIKRLLAGGAKLEARTPQGVTPLSMALIVTNYDGAEALIEAGARLSPEVGKKLLTTADNPRLVDLVARATAGK